MKILVTGGAGFIGSHVVDAYVDDGHDVVVIDNLSTGKRKNINKQARFYEMDVRDMKINDILRIEKPDVVNHHAAQINARLSIGDPQQDLSINVAGTINLIEACVPLGLKKFIFASSAAVYGEQSEYPATELCPARPLNPYGVNKLAVEYYLNYYGMVHGMKWMVFRYSNVYGPRQNSHSESGVIASFCCKILSGEQPVIYGDGTQTRDFVFIDDVVSANRAGLLSDVSGVYNVGTGIETDVNTLYEKLRSCACSSLGKAYATSPQRELIRSCLEPHRLKMRHWTPKVKLDDGIVKTLLWLKEQS